MALKTYAPLDWIVYNKQEVKELIITDFGWRDSSGKHYENVFTRFYQGYILSNKFGIDKPKSHLSTLIYSSQITRRKAFEEWQNSSAYPDKNMEQSDKVSFIKKLKMTENEFEDYISAPHQPSTLSFLQWYYEFLKTLLQACKKITVYTLGADFFQRKI